MDKQRAAHALTVTARFSAAFREHLPSEWMKTSWDRWHMLQANKTPLPEFDVWTAASRYTATADGDYVLQVDAEAEGSAPR